MRLWINDRGGATGKGDQIDDTETTCDEAASVSEDATTTDKQDACSIRVATKVRPYLW